MSCRELAGFLCREAEGESTGVRAGLLGEVASHNEPDHADWTQYRLTEPEEILLGAVADTQRATGLAVSTHASLGRGGVAQVRTMLEAGADASRIVIGHCDAQMHEDIQIDLVYYRALLSEGAQLEFDLFGWDEMMPDAERFRRVAALVAEGFASRILLSTDTCRLSQLRRHGGRGFDYLFTTVIPGLREAGVPPRAIEQMTVRNPARILRRARVE
jgi:phosphotriesterase-related protein